MMNGKSTQPTMSLMTMVGDDDQFVFFRRFIWRNRREQEPTETTRTNPANLGDYIVEIKSATSDSGL